VPSLDLQPNTCGGKAKKITSSPYRKSVGATQKKKIKEGTKSKTNQLASNALLGPSKGWKRRVCRDPNLSNTPSDSDTDQAVPFDDKSMGEEQDADCVYCTGRFSKDHKGKNGYEVQNISDGHMHFILVWRKILFVSLVRDKHCLFLVCILCIYIFF